MIEADSFSTSLPAYAHQTENELLAASRLVAALYKAMADFPLFVSVSLLYFAAVSFAETAHRLGKKELAASFLLHDHPTFGPQCRSLLNRVESGRGSKELIEQILRVIEPFNVAGLGDPARRNWYPVRADDLYRNASKVGATREEISQLLNRCGF
jgi:FADH2 O2-dependent halogenase